MKMSQRKAETLVRPPLNPTSLFVVQTNDKDIFSLLKSLSGGLLLPVNKRPDRDSNPG